eukprot:528227_1
MLKIVARACAPMRQGKFAMRAFSSKAMKMDGGILGEDEMSTGRRGKEVKGLVFRDSPIIPSKDAGTLTKPIEVPSSLSSRVVGFEDPTTHSVYWFNLDKGNTHYVEMIDKYFKLVPIGSS